ncbi:sigma factor-like helix-turn-helix DNA-binding protein [Desulfobacula sp.]|uniref:sigma factor-like helix-turn-helix DNA-binding protein n=1 Tax=Desulfobacula sp. TaxID=2593537 RepID=UPI0026145A13|nr:sigma factor-like helix-turn-helix DNA-binding protein [Desulfobacula sp.]
MKNCGYKKIGEIKRIQNTVNQVVKIIQSQNAMEMTDFKSMIKFDKKTRELFDIGDAVDPTKPFLSLDVWILSISKKSKRNKNVFMLRMGMLGKLPQTYEQIALKYDISRERVRMIVKKLKMTGLRPIYGIRLDPLIEQTERIVRSSGGKIAFSDLITRLLEKGPQGELLKDAVPFIEYLKEFPQWKKTGLKIKNGYIVIESNLDF